MTEVEFAAEFSKRVHYGQVDKAGCEYWKHPKAVADMCDSDAEKIVAYLHDVVEDTCVTNDEIRLLFGDAVADSVFLITHPKGMPYMDQIKRLSVDPVARNVKKADLRHNMDLSRLPVVTDRDVKRRDKYAVALEYLSSVS